jgi:hypothetical protein
LTTAMISHDFQGPAGARTPLLRFRKSAENRGAIKKAPPPLR